MKILYITESFPSPLDSGGKIVSYQMLKMLSAKHEIYLVALDGSKPSTKNLRAITSLGIKTSVFISKKRNPWYKQSKLEFIQALFSFKPPTLTSFYEKSLANQINKLLDTEKFDIIHIEHLSMAQYFPKIKKTTWILQEQNIEYKLYYDFYRTSPRFSKEQFFHFCNAWMLSIYERKILRAVDQIILLSEQDKLELAAIGVRKEKMLVIPPYIVSKESKRQVVKKQNEILFIGNLWWKPNLDAITWFLEKIFPLIQAVDRSILLTIIGVGVNLLSTYANNNKSIRLLKRQHDITPYLKRARVFILPFRIGQGVRIKALTAFSHGLPVVSTAVGVRGLQVRVGKEYLKAESPSEFAEQIIKLIHKPKLQEVLATNAAQFLQKNHNSTSIKRNLLKHYGVVPA